jgi:hypothetical protein
MSHNPGPTPANTPVDGTLQYSRRSESERGARDINVVGTHTTFCGRSRSNTDPTSEHMDCSDLIQTQCDIIPWNDASEPGYVFGDVVYQLNDDP